MRSTFLIVFWLICTALYSQAPALIPYQAVARDAEGQPLSNATIIARFTIHDISPTGNAVWQEMQTVSTNSLGLFTAQLGSSIPITFVNWGSGNKFIQVEIDLGQGYLNLGTMQLLSVPYALLSSKAQHADNALNAGNGYSHVSASGDTLYFLNGNFLIIPGISAANGGFNVILGCTNSSACNFNETATVDNGSCVFPGCIDPMACNYDTSAGCDSGNCNYSGENCSDNNAYTFNDVWTTDCLCEGVPGITGTTLHTCGTQNVHNPNLTYGSMTDQEGNVYKTIIIGTQEWMAENLKTNIYRNGEAIPNVTDDGIWSTLSSGAWSYYNNNENFSCPYGKLYNWYTCVDPRGLCPNGWHVPTDIEWGTLINFLDPNADYINGVNEASGALKSTGYLEGNSGLWYLPNTAATNSSGFSGAPGGYRFNTGGFTLINYCAIWWTATESDENRSYLCHTFYSSTLAGRLNYFKKFGLGVRCLRD
jgi:uncharacterized protein (TIGR02145 family)